MNNFYTRDGDDGFTGMLGDQRIPKHHPRMQAIGALDEATAALGVVRASCKGVQTKQITLTVQRDLYHIMAEVAASPQNAPGFRKINSDRVHWLEEKIAQISKEVIPPREFIVPGDSLSGAYCAVARSIVRRAERHISQLIHQDMVENQEVLSYINRLSSLYFLLELYENVASGKQSPTTAKTSSQG